MTENVQVEISVLYIYIYLNVQRWRKGTACPVILNQVFISESSETHGIHM